MGRVIADGLSERAADELGLGIEEVSTSINLGGDFTEGADTVFLYKLGKRVTMLFPGLTVDHAEGLDAESDPGVIPEEFRPGQGGFSTVIALTSGSLQAAFVGANGSFIIDHWDWEGSPTSRGAATPFSITWIVGTDY